MTGFTDWTELGILPLQDHAPEVDPVMRYQVVGGRIVQAGDPSKWQNPDDSIIRYGKVSGMGTLGDIGQWGFWQTKDRAERGTGTWSQATAVLTTKMLQGGRYGTEIQPIRDSAYRNDLRYAPKAIAPGRALSYIPAGMLQLLVPGSEESQQLEFVVNADSRLVCPSTEGPTECGTLVVDLQPAGVVCMGGARNPGQGGRQAVLHSIFRVCAFNQTGGKGGFPGDRYNLVALNYTQTGGGEGGYGAVFIMMDRGELRPTTGGGGYRPPGYPPPPPPPPPPATGEGSTGFQGGAHGPVTWPTATPATLAGPPGTGEEAASAGPGRGLLASKVAAEAATETSTGSGAFGGGLSIAFGVTEEETRAPFLFGNPTPKQRPDHGIAMMAWRGPGGEIGGPIHGGTLDDDRHNLGVDADGHPVNAAHIWTRANFYRDKDKDGPLFFEGDYPDVVSHPIPSPVHLTWDEDSTAWRWWAEVPDMDGGGDPDPPPEPEDPPPMRPPTGGTPAPAPATPGPAAPAPGGPSPAPGGRPATPGPSAPATPGPGGGTPGAGGSTPGPQPGPTPGPAPGGGGGGGGSGGSTPGPQPGSTPGPTPGGAGTPPPAGGDSDFEPIDNRPPRFQVPPELAAYPWQPYEPPAGPRPEEPENATFYETVRRRRARRRREREMGGPEGRATWTNQGAEAKPERAGAITRVGEGNPEIVGAYQVFSPFMRSFAAVSFRPQLWVENYPSFEHNPRASMALLRSEERTRPQVVTMRAWGAQADGDWSYVKSPRESRARGGEALGGIVFTPPQYEMEDYFGLGETIVTDPGANDPDRYVLAAPGVAFAFGKPELDGGLQGRGTFMRESRDSNRGVEVVGTTSTGTNVSVFTAGLASNDEPQIRSQGHIMFPDNKGIVMGSAENAVLYYSGAQVVLASDSGAGIVLVNGNLVLLDNDIFALGNALDAWIYYNGINLVVDPDVVGTGDLIVHGTINQIGPTSTLRPPRLTTAQRNAITAETGDTIYNTTTGQLEVYDGTEWTGFIAKQGVLTVDGNSVLTQPQRSVNVDATSGAKTITLFPAADGEEVNIKKIDATANPVTIEGDGTETIDGMLSRELSNQYESLSLYSDGTEWFIR